MIKPLYALEISKVPRPVGVVATLKALKDRLKGGERQVAALEPYAAVDLVNWVPPGRKWVNFGDELSRALVALMLARRGYTTADETPKRVQLLGLGSILHFADEGATVWGSGVNGTKAEWHHAFTTLDVRAVRGPYTQEFLNRRGIHVPDIYGDPGLLTPLLTGNRFSRRHIHAVGVIHHFSDKIEEPVAGTRYINPLGSWNSVIQQVLDCDFVVSSSLHGIIIAEAFGIPARYFRQHEREGILKYRDYYEGTGRADFLFARSVEEALEMGGERSPAFDPMPLLQAFPYDLWGAHD